jgi:hypothetical protein
MKDKLTESVKKGVGEFTWKAGDKPKKRKPATGRASA